MKTVAQIVSVVLHPFVTIVVMVVVTVWRRDSFSSTLSAVTAVVALAMLPVAGLILYKFLTREWTTIDASRRTERPMLYAISLAAVLGLVLFLTIKSVGSGLLRGSVCTFGLLLCAWIINRWVKISLHMALASLAATVLIDGGSLVGWGILALLPALAWSRLKLNRHTPGELLLGIAAGTITGLAIHLTAEK